MNKNAGIRYRNGIYYLHTKYRGVPLCERAGNTLKVANRILRQRKNEIDEGRCFVFRSLTVVELLNHYWEAHLKEKKYSVNSKYSLTALRRYIGGFEAIKLRRSDIQQYVNKRLQDKQVIHYKKNGEWYEREGKPISARTIRAELEQLTIAYNIAVDDELIPHNPISRHVRTVKKNSLRYRPKKIVLDEGVEDGEEWQALYAEMDEDAKPVVLCLYETGMRPTEVFKMRWSWIEKISNDRWIIHIPPEDEKIHAVKRIPVSARLLKDLKRLKASIKPEITSRRGRRVRADITLVYPSSVSGGILQTIHTAFRGAVRRAGLEGRGLTPYALRRTRLSIWDDIDSPAAKYASGHAVEGSHHNNYVRFPNRRLFRLVGLEMQPKAEFSIADNRRVQLNAKQ